MVIANLARVATLRRDNERDAACVRFTWVRGSWDRPSPHDIPRDDAYAACNASSIADLSNLARRFTQGKFFPRPFWKGVEVDIPT
jgi:hypothetical protein